MPLYCTRRAPAYGSEWSDRGTRSGVPCVAHERNAPATQRPALAEVGSGSHTFFSTFRSRCVRGSVENSSSDSGHPPQQPLFDSWPIGSPGMPNDAKLGLVVGVAARHCRRRRLYRKDAPAGDPAAIDKIAPASPAESPSSKEATVAKATGFRRHTVQSGETLTSLARQYLGDENKAAAIRDVNPALQGQSDPPAGTVLVIPDIEAAAR